MHADFREIFPEKLLEKHRFCLYSTFRTFVDVIDIEIELELKDYRNRDWLLPETKEVELPLKSHRF